jgi:hypothetical protein
MLRSCSIATILACALGAQTQVSLGSIKDNTLYFDVAGALSNGAGSRMFAGRTGPLTGGLVRRAVVAFDVGRIPRRSTVRSVAVSLYMAQTLVNSQSVDLHRVLADWGEGTSVAASGQGGGAPATNDDVTWIHRRFPGQNWTSAGGDFVAAPSASVVIPNLPGINTWASTPQLVADVQAWVDAPGQNFGWMVRTDETQTTTAMAFETRESATPGNRPLLMVTYDPPVATVIPTGTGCTGGGGSPLTLGTNGQPTVPNPAFAFTVGGGPAGPSVVLMTLAMLPIPIPIGGGCFVYVDPFTLLITLPGGPSVPLPIPNDPNLLGHDFSFQAAAVNATTLALATANALTLVFGT